MDLPTIASARASLRFKPDSLGLGLSRAVGSSRPRRRTPPCERVRVVRTGRPVARTPALTLAAASATTLAAQFQTLLASARVGLVRLPANSELECLRGEVRPVDQAGMLATPRLQKSLHEPGRFGGLSGTSEEGLNALKDEGFSNTSDERRATSPTWKEAAPRVQIPSPALEGTAQPGFFVSKRHGALHRMV